MSWEIRERDKNLFNKVLLKLLEVSRGHALGPAVCVGSAVNIRIYLYAVSWRQIWAEDFGIISIQVIVRIRRVDDVLR